MQITAKDGHFLAVQSQSREGYNVRLGIALPTQLPGGHQSKHKEWQWKANENCLQHHLNNGRSLTKSKKIRQPACRLLVNLQASRCMRLETKFVAFCS